MTTAVKPTYQDLFDAMAVTVPEGRSGDVAVSRFEVSDRDAQLDALRCAIQGNGFRAVPAGTYTKLTRRGALWMTDTPAERYDHLDFVRTVMGLNLRRVLVNGLGLGMVVRALLRVPSVTQVDVCEIESDVMGLVAQHVAELGDAAGKRVLVVQGDAFEPDVTWSRGTRWDAVWHDVWQDINGDDYEAHKRIRRTYARRAEYQDVWQANTVRRLARTGAWR